MSMTDPIADMLTRIRNANMAGHERVEIPSSKIKAEIARILAEEGFVRNFRLLEDGKQGILRIYLKYGNTKKEKVITNLLNASAHPVDAFMPKQIVYQGFTGDSVSPFYRHPMV